MSVFYGLDLAGYSTKGSAIVAAESRNDTLTVTVLDDHCLGVAAKGTDSLDDKTAKEIACLKQLCNQNCLYVDVPIDLQGLPCPENATAIWQLTKRPVDQAFGALCPLADRIGSYVARMQNLWRLLKQDGNDPLGVKLFETYPAASLALNGSNPKGYKGQALWGTDDWTGVGTETEADQKKNDTLAALLKSLDWRANDGFHLSNDEFDASLCALCGVDERLEGKSLDAKITEQIDGQCFYKAPKGYVLRSNIPTGVTIARLPFADWFKGGIQ